MQFSLRPVASVFDAETRRGRTLRGILLWGGVLGGAFLIGTLILAPMMVDAAGLNHWKKAEPTTAAASATPAVRKTNRPAFVEPAVQISLVTPKSGQTTYKLDDDSRKHEHKRRHHRKHRHSDEDNSGFERSQPSQEQEATDSERRDGEHVDEQKGEDTGDHGGGGDDGN